MRRAMRYMEREGISHFVDFREGGREGADMLIEASQGLSITPVILCRAPYERCHGIGMSSISDHDFDTLKNLSSWAHENGKIFALHASEGSREDIDRVLSLKPHFLVHMLSATDEDLGKLKKAGVPLVITPRSNLFFGKVPNIPRFLRFGITLALGTDNGMLSLPSIFREMEAAYKLSRLNGAISPMEILRMVTVNPRRILGIRDNDIGLKARFIVLRRFMSAYEIVNKASLLDIKRLIL